MELVGNDGSGGNGVYGREAVVVIEGLDFVSNEWHRLFQL